MQDVIGRRLHRATPRELETELVRKTIHLSIAAVPTIAELLGTSMTLALLSAGVLVYAFAESGRRHGLTVPIITRLTELSSRRRDQNHFVLGPITLGLGAMLALLLYPNPAATLAIYALAFGDGIASFAGKLFGRIRMPLTGGKTVEGSLACLIAVAIAASMVVSSPWIVAAAAVSAAFFEALPTGDADNLVLPFGVGLVVSLLM
jgi:dolichol kinase